MLLKRLQSGTVFTWPSPETAMGQWTVGLLLKRLHSGTVSLHLVKSSDSSELTLRHLQAPHSARFSYATEGALFISAQLSSDAVSALRKVWVLIRLLKQPSAQAPHVNVRRIHPG